MIRGIAGRLRGAALPWLALLAGSGYLHAAPSTPADLHAQAEQLLAAGQPDQAAAKLQEALAIDPRHWPSLCRLGEIHAVAKRHAEAERALRASVEINPDSGACFSRLAQVLLVTDQLDEAERALVRAAQLLPGDQGLQFNLGRLYENTGRRDLAIEAYCKHLDLAPDSPRAAATHLKVGRFLMEKQRPGDAIPHYQAYLKANPDRIEVRPEMANAYKGASRYQEALEQYDMVIAAGTADVESLASAGTICLLLRQLPRAVELLDKAVAAQPGEVPARVSLATALAQSGDHSRAVEALQGVIADDPENVRAHYLLAQSLMKLGRAEEARQALERHQRIHETIMRERMSADAPP